MIPVTECSQNNDEVNTSVARAMAAAEIPGVQSAGPIFNFYFGPKL